MDKNKLIKQEGNSGYMCQCGAYMYANIYENETVCICPQCGAIVMFKEGNNEKK